MEFDQVHRQWLPSSPSPAPRQRPKGPRGNLQDTIPRGLRPTRATSLANNTLPTTYNPTHSRDTSNASSIFSYTGVETTAQAFPILRPLSIRPITDKTLPVVETGKTPYPTKPSQILRPTRANTSKNQQIADTHSTSPTTTSSITKDLLGEFPDVPPPLKLTQPKVVQVIGKSNNGNKRNTPTEKRDNFSLSDRQKPTKVTTNTNTNTTHHPVQQQQQQKIQQSIRAVKATPTRELTSSDTTKVTGKHTLLNASNPPIYPSPSLLSLSHDEPRLVPDLEALPSILNIKTPPGEVVINDNDDTGDNYYHYSTDSIRNPNNLSLYNSIHDYDHYNYHNSNKTPSTGIDVDRLAMVEGSHNVNNDHLGVPPFLTPAQQLSAARHGSYSSPGTPATSSTPARHIGGLEAITNIASDLPFDSTPMSTSESIDSSHTVIRRRGYTGPIPAGYYSLFPPVATPASGSSRFIPSRARSRRSSSAPPRPVSEGPLSPLSAGSNSPISPLSPQDNDSLYGSPRPHTRSRSESLHLPPPSLSTPTVLFPEHDSNRTSQSTISNQIPRKPVGRSNAVRWNSNMSTIQSESEGDASSSAGASRGARSSANTAMVRSATSSKLKLKDEFRRSSTALPPTFTPEEVPVPSTSATIDFSQVDTAFPMDTNYYPGESQEDLGQLRRRISNAAGKRRADSDALTFASLPSRKQSGPIISPTSTYSRVDYRDSQSQTELGMKPDRPSSLLREDLPAWARLYYSNEKKHRNTLGRAPSFSGSSRRHTVGTTFGIPDSLRVVRNQGVPRNPHTRQISLPADRSVFQGEDLYPDRSPHLFHGRTAAIKRRTVFIAPSLDEQLEGNGLSRRNAQVWCFVLGFVFPLTWWVASILPLPPCPRTPPTTPGFEHDLEKTLGPYDLARYENARWWRNINRIMSVVGVGVIVAIIVLAVVASRMASSPS